MLRKEVTKTKEELIENITQGVKYAQDALALDSNDATSWYIMGNAFISSFFNIKQSAKTLSQAMDAYNRAVCFFSTTFFSVFFLFIISFINLLCRKITTYQKAIQTYFITKLWYVKILYIENFFFIMKV